MIIFILISSWGFNFYLGYETALKFVVIIYSLNELTKYEELIIGLVLMKYRETGKKNSEKDNFPYICTKKVFYYYLRMVCIEKLSNNFIC